MAQQRQRAGAVVRQPKHHAGPRHARPSLLVRQVDHALDHGAMRACQPFHFVQRHRMHAARGAFGSLPQRQRQHPARAEQAKQFAPGPRAVGRQHVLPYAAEQDDVEGVSLPVNLVQRRQRVVDPADGGFGMPGARFGALRPRARLRRRCGFGARTMRRRVRCRRRRRARGWAPSAEDRPAVQSVGIDRLVGVGEFLGVRVIPADRLGRCRHDRALPPIRP